MKKERLDILLVNRGLFESRAKAQAAVMAGQILVNEQKIDKPGTQINPEVTIRILGNKLPYVSRGGLKLEKALQIFPISVQDKVVVDIGASTGGFTDCALQNGAAKVYAIDVGYGQLAWKLRNDERVVNMERTNVRYLEADSLPEQFVRCHRGFIVNRKKIKTISYSQKLIFLNNDMLVPLSRGYKNSLDSALKGGAQRLTETII